MTAAVQPSLFDAPPPSPAAPRPRLSGLERAERGKARAAGAAAHILAVLEPIARELARARAPEPITVDDVIAEAEQRRIELGDCPDHLGALMKRAGLRATGERVRSERPEKHGNWRMCWRWVEGR